MFGRRNRREEGDELEGGTIEELPDRDNDPSAGDGDRPEDLSADLESQAADYLADNDAWVYGPNAAEVLAVLDQLEEIGPGQAEVIAETWSAATKSERDRARKAVQKIYESDSDVARYVQNARQEVSTWLAVKSGYPEFVAASPDWAKWAARTADAAMDQITALILDEQLEEVHFVTLTEPWSQAIEVLQNEGRLDRPELPDDPGVEEYETDEEDERFGPNTAVVTDFLNRLWMLTPEQIGRLVSAWQEIPRESLHDAHENLMLVVDEDEEYRDQVKRAQAELSEWLNSGRIQETAGFLGQSGQGESRKMAGPALADAVAALVLGDLLDPPDAQLLYRAWLNLIGGPALPVPVDEDPTAKAKAKPKPAAKPTSEPASKPAAKAAGKSAPKSSSKPR